MKTAVCFYFQVHQPFRLRKDYDFFSIGKNHNFIDHTSNRQIMEKIAKNCYLPANKVLLEAIKKNPGKINISFSISGTALEQFELYTPEVLESFQELAQTGNVEFLAETWHHSLASVLSENEFVEQVKLHRDKIQKVFGQKPTTFRNTELIYNNRIATIAEQLGFTATLAEGVDKMLGWRSPNFIYTPKDTNIALLLKNYKLSDEIAFRFSNKFWRKKPLTAAEYMTYLEKLSSKKVPYIGLFMDYETFGEHHRKEDGILSLLAELMNLLSKNDSMELATPKEVARTRRSMGELDIPEYTSWADRERDLSAWLGNSMQNSTAKLLYSMEKDIKTSKNEELIRDWRRLLTSDHNYYACTKYYGDGAVHNYFSPYNSPHDAFMIYANAINDVKIRLERTQNQTES